jgi:predicted permease
MSPRRGTGALRVFAARLRGLVRGHPPDDELDAEIQEHLRLLAERFAAQGMSREEAAVAARRQFGSPARLREDLRELSTLSSIEALWSDLRYVLRTLARSPGFAAVGVATLGLGIGAVTAIFSVIDNVMLAPFPYAHAERMVFPRIEDVQQGAGSERQGYTAAEVLELAEANRAFDGLTAAFGELVLYRHAEGTDYFGGARVIPGSFEFFGMKALHGRVLQPADYEPGAPPVFVMRHKAWIDRFGGDASVLGQSLLLNGVQRTLVGVMPPRFGWYGADVFIPQSLARDAKLGSMSTDPYWFLLGRLRPGVSIQEAEADLTLVARRLAKAYPQAYPKQFAVRVKPLGDSVVGRIEATLYTVLAAVGLLLTIACSNVANLMLARATAREKEFALRAVLGAGRARLVRLLMVESLVLAAGGAALGIFLAWAGLKSLVAAMPSDVIPSESVIELDAPVLALAVGVAVVTALVFGLAPALQSSRRDVNDTLRDSAKGAAGGFRGGRLRDAVVVMEVALSLTLLIGAGLLMRSFVALREVQLGVRADHVFTTLLALPEERYQDARQVAGFMRPLLERLEGLPGVLDAAAANAVPPYGGAESVLEVAGGAPGDDRRTLFQLVSEGYFGVLRLSLREGRVFTREEVDGARMLAVVNETFAKRHLSEGAAVGQRVRLARLDGAAKGAWIEVVGVVADVLNRGLQGPVQPELWLPYTVARSGAQGLLVRTSQDPEAITDGVRRAVWATDEGVALARPGALEDLVGERLYAGPRFGMLLMTVFGAVGLVLVTVGVYSVLAYSATRKTHEIGIRMALGAERRDVVGMIVRGGLRLVLVGVAIGLVASLGFGRMIGGQLTGVAPHDPPTLAATVLLLTATAAVAAWIPARRAARLDPTAALRSE